MNNKKYKHIKKDKTRLKIVLIILIVLICLLGFFIYYNFDNFVIDRSDISNDDTVEEIVVQPERDIWLTNKAINSDYQGEIIFDSGLINQSFVQAKDVYDSNGELYLFYTEYGRVVNDPVGYTGNDVYIWTNWRDFTYDYNILGGSVFMDYRNSLDDQNIIIYGHHFSKEAGNDPDRNKAFTPLEKLLEYSNYEDNRYLSLILDNETRRYELAYSYIFDEENEDNVDFAQYFRTNYDYDETNSVSDPGYYDKYIEYIDSIKLYDTDCELTSEDNTLTLQTCIGGSATRYEILVFKLIDTQYFE